MNPIPFTPIQPQVIPLWSPGEIDTTGWDQPEEIAVLPDGLQVIRNIIYGLSLTMPIRL